MPNSTIFVTVFCIVALFTCTAGFVLDSDILPAGAFGKFFTYPWFPLPGIMRPVVLTPCTTMAATASCTCGRATCTMGQTCTVATNTCATVCPATMVTTAACTCGSGTMTTMCAAMDFCTVGGTMPCAVPTLCTTAATIPLCKCGTSNNVCSPSACTIANGTCA